MNEKWVKFWKGIYVLAFGIRTFLIGNLIFDMWPASIYQLTAMHFGKNNRKKARAILSLCYAYLTALVSIIELFVMFFVSHRIKIIKAKEAEEIRVNVNQGKEIIKNEKEKQEKKIMDVFHDQNINRESFNYRMDIDEGEKNKLPISKKISMTKTLSKDNKDENENSKKSFP